jgi:hypothetical protein
MAFTDFGIETLTESSGCKKTPDWSVIDTKSADIRARHIMRVPKAGDRWHRQRRPCGRVRQSRDGRRRTPHGCKMNPDKGRVRIRGPSSREPRRKSVAAMRHRSFAQEQVLPLAGADAKNRTFMQSPAAQRSGLILSCRDTERLQTTLQSLGAFFA